MNSLSQPNLQTSNGDIFLSAGSTVNGDLLVEGNYSLLDKILIYSGKRKPVLRIDAGTVINGDIHLHQEVDLLIDEDATVGKIHHHY